MYSATTVAQHFAAYGFPLKDLEKEVWLIPASRTMPLSNNNR